MCNKCSQRSDPPAKKKSKRETAAGQEVVVSQQEHDWLEEAWQGYEDCGNLGPMRPPRAQFQADAVAEVAVAAVVVAAAAGSAAAAAAAAPAAATPSGPPPLLAAQGLQRSLTPAHVAGGPLRSEEAEGRLARLSDGRRAVVAPGETMEGRGSKRETAQLKIIHTGTRDQFVVELPPADPIASLKVAIERRAGIPAGRQRLVFGGRELLDGRSVASYGLQGGATLNLVVLDSRYVRGATFPLLS